MAKALYSDGKFPTAREHHLARGYQKQTTLTLVPTLPRPHLLNFPLQLLLTVVQVLIFEKRYFAMEDADSIASAVLEQFRKLPAKRKPAVRDNGLHEWVPLSGIIVKGVGISEVWTYLESANTRSWA